MGQRPASTGSAAGSAAKRAMEVERKRKENDERKHRVFHGTIASRVEAIAIRLEAIGGHWY